MNKRKVLSIKGKVKVIRKTKNWGVGGEREICVGNLVL